MIKKTLWICVITSLVTACATRPIRVGRRGLLERDQGVSNVTAKVTHATESESDAIASQKYAPNKAGEKVELVGRWQWPLQSIKISSEYGDRGAKFHQGVDLHAPMGTRVLAAADGEVVYVGSKIRGYGRMVVLKHAGNFYSVYAHHSKNLVKVGRRIQRGQQIALSGKSGHASGPHLHFEIRKGTQSFDPELALNQNIHEYASNRKVAGE